eukprot:gene12915-15170_t
MLEGRLDDARVTAIREGMSDINVPALNANWSRSKKNDLAATANKSKLAGLSNEKRMSHSTTATKSRNSVNLSEYRTARDGGECGETSRCIREMQMDVEAFNQRMNSRMKSLSRMVEELAQESAAHHQQGQESMEEAEEHDGKFYATLNMELTKELNNEKEKRQLQSIRMADLEKQLAESQANNRELTEERDKLEEQLEMQNEEIDELNDMIITDEQMRDDLMDEIDRLKGSSSQTVGSMNYLVELPKPMIDDLPQDELELFEEVFLANLRIIQEAKARVNQ